MNPVSTGQEGEACGDEDRDDGRNHGARLLRQAGSRSEGRPSRDRCCIPAQAAGLVDGHANPKTRHANQLYLDEIPALRRALLSDPATRAAYDAELAVSQRAERDRKLDELQRRVRLRAAKGGLGQSDRGLLIDEATRLGLNEDDLVRITRPIPNLVEAPSVNGDSELDFDPPADVLDPSTRRQIRMALEHLGCRDLYDALGLTRDAPASDTAARADAERQRWMKKAQVTAEKTAWLEVITHAQSHLGSPRSRARYDRTLALEAEESFDRLAEFALKGLKRLDPGTRAALIEEAAALGIVADRADRLIGRICRRLDITREAGSVAPSPNPGLATMYPAATTGVNGAQRFTLLRCRTCAGVTELSPVARKGGSARCPHCGASLRWNCPVCRRTRGSMSRNAHAASAWRCASRSFAISKPLSSPSAPST